MNNLKRLIRNNHKHLVQLFNIANYIHNKRGLCKLAVGDYEKKLIKALEREYDFDVLENDKFEFFHNSIFLNIVDVRIERLATGEIYDIKNYNIESGSFEWCDDNDDDEYEDDYGLISPMDEEEYEVCLSEDVVLVYDPNCDLYLFY